MVAIYSVINFIVNGISAFSMSAKYGNDSAYAYLFYGICAYVFTLIPGIVCDVVTSKIKNNTGLIHRRFYWGVTLLGIIFSLLGMYFGLYALGVGNALVTVGAGLGCMHRDSGKSNGAKNIGIFLAAGVPGLWLGNVLADFTSVQVYIQNIWIALMIIMIVIGFMHIIYRERSLQFVALKQTENIYSDSRADREEAEGNEEAEGGAGFKPVYILIVLACLIISAVGGFILKEISFDWRQMLILSLVSLLAMAAGRLLGAYLPCVIKSRTLRVVVSIGIGALAVTGIFFRKIAAVGIAELLLTNVLMSGSIYFSTYNYKKLRGLSLGIACTGLYLGFLTSYFLNS